MVKQTKKTTKKTVKSVNATVKKSASGKRTIIVKNADGDADTKATILVQNKIDYVPKVSVIIPVYNVEQYLRECLDSVVNQTLKEIEIICVDDGSTDSSLEILKEYAKKDKRITVITQKNLHAGVARNAGLSVAKGEYLSFLDSDDFFELNMLEDVYNKAIHDKSDIVMFNCYLFDDTTKENKEVEWTLDIKNVPSVFNYKDITDRIFKLSNCWVWNRLYNHQFINNYSLRFQNIAFSNDVRFSCMAMVFASKIVTLNNKYVHYRINQKHDSNVTGSLNRIKFPTASLQCFKSLYDILNKHNIYKTIQMSFLVVCAENLYWTMNCLIKDSKAYNLFVEFIVKNYKNILRESCVDLASLDAKRKYVVLRNLLVDAGVFKEIPKRIFYVWGANEPIRPEVQQMIDTWVKNLPDYDIIQINDESTQYFNFQQELQNNKWFRTVYERKMWAYVADYVRVKTLYDNGGIYFDTDVSVVQNMDKFLTEPAFVGIQMSSLDGTGDWVEPAICGARKHNKFFGKVASFYDELIWKEPIYTMPHLFNYYLRKEDVDIFPFPIKEKQKIIKLKDITIYPECYFIPYRFRNQFTPQCIESNTHTIHHWGGSWVKPEVQYFLKYKHLPHIKMSVIISIYNDEQYLSQCLESVINQSLRDIEVICVNDGSTDDSLKILEKYAKKDSRITVINQKNSGLATSRNNALKLVRGEYCQFVDSDDYLEKDALQKLYEYAKNNDLDMLAFSGYNFNKDNEMLDNPYWNFTYLPKNWNKTVFTYKDCLDFMHRMSVSSCLTTYKMEFILKNKLQFPDGLVYEDNIFWTKAFTQNARFGILNEKLYLRRLHDMSITYNWKKNLSDYIQINDLLFDYLKSINISDKIFENYKTSRIDDILFRFNRLDLNEQKSLQKHLDNLLNKYSSKSVKTKKHIKPYILFPYYFLAIMWMKLVRIPVLKYKKHLKQVLYSHSYRGMIDKMNQYQQNVTDTNTKLKSENKVLSDKLAQIPSHLKKIENNYQYKLHKYCPENKRAEALKDWYYERTGEQLNLDNPQTFNEKIQWLKLHDSTPLKTRLADKYLVRDWVAEKIGEQYLIPLLGVWDSFDEIDFDKLPNQFVLKCNHGCGYNIIVTDKSKFDIEDARKKINTWMNEDFAFKCGFEMHYSDIPRKIIAEQYIENDGNDLYDYKFWCFNGKVKYIQYIAERKDFYKMAFYDTEWVKQNFITNHEMIDYDVPKPKNLSQIIKLVEILAKTFSFVRIDFYILNDGTVKFGEMTFTPFSGLGKWQPKNKNLEIGKMIKLPIQKHKTGKNKK